MSKMVSTKSKLRPWIPPGTNTSMQKKSLSSKPQTGSKDAVNPTSPKASPKKLKENLDVSKEVSSVDKKIEPDVFCLSPQLSPNEQYELDDIHLSSVHQETKLFRKHFDVLKSLYLSVYRSFAFEDNIYSDVNELTIEVGAYAKELNALFDDLLDSVFELENTLEENQRELKYSEVYLLKQKSLSRLLDMYQKVIVLFRTVFEKQDYKELSLQNESLITKLRLIEKASISQEAIIKDLERKLSVNESKSAAMESYKTSLECAKAELEKQLSHKDSQIKYLNNELMNSSERKSCTDVEGLMEIIQNMKSKFRTEKSALKKALKFQRSQTERKEEKNQQLMQEMNEREKTMFDLANQRDQLKIQLTVFNNNIIQQKTEIEEIKNQQLKLQDELANKDITHKKEIMELRNNLEEKSAELSKAIKAKTNLEESVEELENELKEFKKQLKILRADKENLSSIDIHQSKNGDVLQELATLLQNTKEMFESFKESSHIISARGDQTVSDAEYGSIKDEILAAVTETNEHLSELKNLYRAFLQEQKESPQQKQQHLRKNDLDKRLKKMEELYNAVLKENRGLKQEIEELKSSSPTAQKTENFSSANTTNDVLKLKLQSKNEEMRRLKDDVKISEEYLEKQLKETKEKLRTLEIDHINRSSLEEELKSTKLELATLRKKKDEEAERLLQRIEELQSSLDLKNKEYDIQKNHVQYLKSSYCNVFCDSQHSILY